MAKDAHEALRLIAADAKNDALSLDGKPFDGREVGKQFGKILASIHHLAKTMETLIPTKNDDDN